MVDDEHDDDADASEETNDQTTKPGHTSSTATMSTWFLLAVKIATKTPDDGNGVGSDEAVEQNICQQWRWSH